MHRYSFKSLSSTLIAILTIFTAIGACAKDKPDTVPEFDTAKMNMSNLMTGPYSFMVPPYSYYYFHHMNELNFRLDWIRHSGAVYKLKETHTPSPFTVTYQFHNKTYTLDQYYKRDNVTAFLILKDNQIISERYFYGSDINSHFVSNSMQKSFTSTLVGIALDEGKIASIDDPIIKYLPYLSQSGYKDVTIKQALEMTSGTDANEDYLDPHTTFLEFAKSIGYGKPSFSDYLKTLKSKYKPGTHFSYESVDTEVLGLLVEKATGVPLNKYIQDKIWSKIGAQSDAFLYRAKAQPDQCAFGCLNATLRDYGRFGLTMMNNGMLDGYPRVVSSSWVKQATIPQPGSVQPEGYLGYAYQWWIPHGQKDAVYEAVGIFGQIIYVNPAKHVVIVQTAAWPQPETEDNMVESLMVMDAIANKISD